MFSSSKISYLFLRIGMACVFLWFGIDKFLSSSYWLSVWVPPGIHSILGRLGLADLTFIYAVGVFEILIGLSLLFSVFIKFFSFLAIIFLTAILITNRVAEPLVRDVAIIGGLMAVIFWPGDRNRY